MEKSQTKIHKRFWTNSIYYYTSQQIWSRSLYKIIEKWSIWSSTNQKVIYLNNFTTFLITIINRPTTYYHINRLLCIILLLIIRVIIYQLWLGDAAHGCPPWGAGSVASRGPDFNEENFDCHPRINLCSLMKMIKLLTIIKTTMMLIVKQWWHWLKDRSFNAILKLEDECTALTLLCSLWLRWQEAAIPFGLWSLRAGSV